MRVLILGATGRIGGLAREAAVAEGHEVVALIRDGARLKPRTNLIVLQGDLADAAAIGLALRGVEAVIAAVGPRANSLDQEHALETGMRNVVAAMTATSVRRLVALSGAGISVPGDHKPWLDRVASRIVRRVARHVVGAKQREYDVFAASDLDWTALRPPLVTDGPPVGYRLDIQLLPGARVRRADVAAALVHQLGDDRYLRAAPFVLPRADQQVYAAADSI